MLIPKIANGMNVHAEDCHPLWFDSQAEEAVKFYVSLIGNSDSGDIARYGDPGPGPKGSVMTIAFKLAGQNFLALNGGPMYTFSPAISLS